jgi:hypothetical protein
MVAVGDVVTVSLGVAVGGARVGVVVWARVVSPAPALVGVAVAGCGWAVWQALKNSNSATTRKWVRLIAFSIMIVIRHE